MTWIYIVGAVAAALVAAMLVAGTHALFNVAVLSDNHKKKTPPAICWEEDENRPETVTFAPQCVPYINELIEGRKAVKELAMTDYSVTSYDGLTLMAKFIPAEDMRGIVLMMHGFRSNPLHDFSLAILEYNKMGFGCFLPYQRAHGNSEGKYICYGVKERHDVLSWCDLIGKEFPGVPVILDGISMGASTVMMASGLVLPDFVKGIVADCGFTSAREIFAAVLKNRLRMKPFPFLYTATLATRIRAGYGAGSVSTEKELKKNSLPILIVHGEDDDLVPHEMSVRNFAAAKEVCDATFLSVPGAGHGLSFLIDSESYLKEVKKLVGKCIK